ncbi:UvrD-helicase domain-containing protein [Ruania alba]|uniref:UvrD-helicase domain-containing protein n=1 Tax=Ruania alba TaxID=648782 RepID=UPI001587BE8B|nr:UvrD-helicase domain-containing protein [Ruania alba]
MATADSLVHRLSGAADEARAAILAGGHHVVHGAPGTGKTTTALLTFTEWVRQDPGAAVLLVPTRRRAAAVRDQVSARLQRTTGAVLVRTPASLAFTILRLRASHLGEPAPTLVTGPEQDQALAELLAGHAEREGAPIGWPESVSRETLGLRAFRNELRDLLMRAAEAGLDGEGLTAWGERHHRPEWCAAGRVLTEYTQVMSLGQTTPDRGARYDAATIVDEAVLALRTWEDTVPDVPRPRWSLVLHDDYQDATLATARLLDTLVDDGARVAVFGDADLAVQQFRGGVPALLHTASLPPGRDGAWGATEHVLDDVHRHPAAVREAVTSLTASLPSMAETRRRRARAEPGDGRVRAVLLSTDAQQVAYIARHLREQHVHADVPWSQMAVVVRSGSLVGAVRRGLRTAGVPLAMATPDRPLRDEPAVRPLLVSLRCAITGDVTPEDAAALLVSPIGGMDAVGVRALRRALRQAERRRAGSGTPRTCSGSCSNPPFVASACVWRRTNCRRRGSLMAQLAQMARMVRSVRRPRTRGTRGSSNAWPFRRRTGRCPGPRGAQCPDRPAGADRGPRRTRWPGGHRGDSALGDLGDRRAQPHMATAGARRRGWWGPR